MSFRLLYSYNTTASRKFFPSFCSQCEQNTASDWGQQLYKAHFAPEYNGRTAHVNKNLGFVLKAEQCRRLIEITRPMRLGTAVALTLPRFEQLFRCCEVTVDMASGSTKLRSCPISCRLWQPRGVAAGLQSQNHGCSPALSFTDSSSTSFRSSRSELAPQTRCVEPRSFDQPASCTISCMKKKFSKRVDCGCMVHSSLESTSGIDPKFPNCHLSRPARSGR